MHHKKKTVMGYPIQQCRKQCGKMNSSTSKSAIFTFVGSFVSRFASILYHFMPWFCHNLPHIYYFLNTDIQYEKVIISSQPDRTLKIIKNIIFRSPALDWGCYFQQQNKDKVFFKLKIEFFEKLSSILSFLDTVSFYWKHW